MALTLADADRAIDAARQAAVPLQVGFNRRYDAGFRAAHDTIAAGGIGTPQLLRSLTRDPKLADPAAEPRWSRPGGGVISAVRLRHVSVFPSAATVPRAVYCSHRGA